MRSLAARLGVVPGAVYHHVRNKQQLQDLVLDNVLAEVDVHLDHALGWTDQLKVLAHRLRQVLEEHPGVAGILKTRDPLGPHSLALAEAFLEPLQAAGFGDRDAGLAFFLLVDYTIGFAVSDTSTSVNEQRVRDPANQSPAAPVLPLPAPRPIPRPGRPGRTRLGRQPRRAVHRRAACAGRWVGARAQLPQRPHLSLGFQHNQDSRLAQCLANLTCWVERESWTYPLTGRPAPAPRGGSPPRLRRCGCRAAAGRPGRRRRCPITCRPAGCGG